MQDPCFKKRKYVKVENTPAVFLNPEKDDLCSRGMALAVRLTL